MPFSFLNPIDRMRAVAAKKREEQPKLLHLSKFQERDYVHIEVIGRTDGGAVRLKVLEVDAGREAEEAYSGAEVVHSFDVHWLRFQTPEDRHFMTTIGAQIWLTVKKSRRINLPCFEVRKVKYGLETWDTGFYVVW